MMSHFSLGTPSCPLGETILIGRIKKVFVEYILGSGNIWPGPLKHGAVHSDHEQLVDPSAEIHQRRQNPLTWLGGPKITLAGGERTGGGTVFNISARSLLEGEALVIHSIEY